MDKQDLTELLDTQAAGLLRGQDLSEVLLAQVREPERGLARDLMQLAGRLKSRLVQVEPRPDFVAQLKARLASRVEPAAQARSPLAPAHKALWIAGGLVYVFGIWLVSWRVALSLIAAFINWRTARPVLAPARAPRIPR